MRKFFTIFMAALITLGVANAAQNTTKKETTMPKKITQTAGRTQLGEFAPKFAELNDDVLFGDVWNRNAQLSWRDRSIITVVTLMSSGILDSSLLHHIQNAKNHGVTKDEMAEIITHAAFYAGWPKAWGAFRIAKDVYKDEKATSELEKFANTMAFPLGKENTAYAKYFIGKSYLAPMTKGNLNISNVTFEPKTRNNWHIHHAKSGGGQILIVVAGRGWYQEWGKKPQMLSEGDIVEIPAGVKHWHGAVADSYFAHLAIAVPGEETSNEWLEPVDDAAYNALEAAAK